MNKAKRIIVLGAGVVGLSSAVQLQAKFPSAAITIIAEKFDKETTSDGAAGIFRPTKDKTPGVPLTTVKQWLQDSWNHYNRLVHSEDASEAGVKILSGYLFFNKDIKDPLDKEIVYHHRPCTADEVAMFPGERFKNGFFITTIMTECRHYLPYLTKKFLNGGGKIVKKRINSIDELVGQCDVLVNCAGLGNIQLLNDQKLVPIRGQLLRVQAPWLKHFVYTGEDANCYIIPGQDNVVIGGTHQIGDTSCEARPTDGTAIMERAIKVVPSLKKAVIEWQWAGLRPHREPLRVERERRTSQNGSLWIVHNYGHGAEGVSLSWGTSKAAVQLVDEILTATTSQL